MTEPKTHGPDAVFRISRTVNGPLDAVWKAYTEQEPLMQWFGPSGVSMPVSHFDLRPGGIFHYCLRTPTGFEMWGKCSLLGCQGRPHPPPHVARLAAANPVHHHV